MTALGTSTTRAQIRSYMASASLRHQSARLTIWAFHTGASHSAADRSSQASPYAPLSTLARISIADSTLGAARKTLPDSALSPWSFHHSGLAASAHCSCRSISKASAVASAQSSEPTG
eukprot:scaffold52034_cov54-Phaeocystis_antarctica.AAC.2